MKAVLSEIHLNHAHFIVHIYCFFHRSSNCTVQQVDMLYSMRIYNAKILNARLSVVAHIHFEFTRSVFRLCVCV